MKRKILSLAIVVLLSALFPLFAETLPDKPVMRWYNVLVKGVKTGYSRDFISNTEYQGKKCIKTESLMKIAIKRMGVELNMETSSLSYIDSGLSPIFFHFAEKQDEQEKITEGRLSGEMLNISIKIAGETKNKLIKFEKGAIMPDAIELLMKKRGYKDKDRFKVRSFNSDSLGFDDLNIAVTADPDKKGWYIIEAETNGVQTTNVVDERGDIIKSNIANLGIEMVKTTEKDALNFSVSELDLMDSTAVQSNVDIPDFRNITEMQATLSFKDGIPKRIQEKLPDGMEVSKDGRYIILKNIKHSFDPKKALSKPITGKEFQPYLVPTTYEQSDDKAIIEKAVAIAGDERNSYLAAKKIVHWVYSNMEKKNFNAGFASASEVLKSREGDCTEHSVLASALCKASGIPTRTAAGFAPLNDRFFYHMWIEVYVGRWVAMDPTFDEDALDASHIKISQGVLDEQGRFDLMLNILQYFNQVKIEITKIK